MYTLIIDSATKVLYHALVKDDKVVKEIYTKGQNDHAKNIVFLIEKMLKEENITVDNLDKIVCGIGPGSYTGVRMAVTVAKMLSSFKNIPLYEISTLKLISSGESGKVLAMIDARRGNAFSAIYQEGNLVLSEAMRAKEEVMKESYDVIVDESNYKVDPFKAIACSVRHENPHSLNPNYLRETEAERNAKNEN